jgi:DNA-binding NtrC family response regulator
VESELFGIEKSVATGVAPRSGFFERADGGTIFLNEIGDVPLATQVRVLQAIEDKEFERVGGSRVIKVDVRVISATNQDLKKLMEAGSFRKDLYFRLNHIWINLPPLRERMDDLPDLIDYFVRKYAAKNSKPVRRVSREAMEALLRYQWPGNVRELERCIEHGVVFTDGEEIGLENLSAGITEPLLPGTLIEPLSRFEGTLPQMVAEFEKLRITEALVKYGWNKSRAARRLGLHEATIRKKMKQYGIEKPRT